MISRVRLVAGRTAPRLHRAPALARSLCAPPAAAPSSGSGGAAKAVGLILLGAGGYAVFGDSLQQVFYQTTEQKVATMRRDSASLKMALSPDLMRSLTDYRPKKLAAHFLSIFDAASGGAQTISTAQLLSIPTLRELKGLNPDLDVVRIFDRNGNGRIERSEFVYGFVLVGMLAASQFQRDTGANRRTIGSNMFEVIDADADGRISFNELRSWISSARVLGLIPAQFLCEEDAVEALTGGSSVDQTVEARLSDDEVALGLLQLSGGDASRSATIDREQFLKLNNALSYAHFFANSVNK
jgi:Ca2+-binding EF-hand superfamily protein